ncbi:MAG TPA: UTP--glucose-1-phosphate uridylyltransferase [Candidatus Binatia bacterium]|nr:UTP--glucose-1-phosphate uridylyltransferase [Candidatus Binatia bacterium]
MNPAEIGARSALGEAYLEGRLAQARLRGEFRPSRREDVTDIERLASAERHAAIARGIEALGRGEVGYGVLAAGASTRMNLADVPPEARHLLERAGREEIKSKAMVPVVEIGGRVLSFLDLFLANVVRLSSETRTSCPIVVLASEGNREEIEGHVGRVEEIATDRVFSFCQTLDPQIVASVADVERSRKNFASQRDVASALELSRRFAGCELTIRKPGGHGEFLHQLISSGTLARLLRRGVRYVSVRNVDNVGGLLDDRWLVILGRMIEAERNIVVEVSRRPDGPAGKGGALIVRPSGDFELAEDPAFAGTGIDPRESYYINNATAILRVEYLFRIYETSEAEILTSSPAKLAAIAERGRRKFPALVDVKPARLSSGQIAGAFVRETNLWESTGVERGLGVDAAGVVSVKDVEEGFEQASVEEQRERALRVRFAPTKKWEDYGGINARLTPHLARRILEGPLVRGRF